MPNPSIFKKGRGATEKLWATEGIQLLKLAKILLERITNIKLKLLNIIFKQFYKLLKQVYLKHQENKQ